MMRYITFVLVVALLAGCEQAELLTAHEISTHKDAYLDKSVRLHGVHVERNRNIIYATTGVLNFLTLEDASGRAWVWYDTSRRRCPPRIGAELTVEGKVIATGKDGRRIFLAKTITVDKDTPLADNEVRLCQLSVNEQGIHAERGPEGLQEYWRHQGKAERVLVYD